MGSHNTPFRTQCHRSHSFLSPINVRPPPNPLSLTNRRGISLYTPQRPTSLVALVPFSNRCGTLTKSTLPHKSTWDLTIHPSGPNILDDTRFFLQSLWDPTKSTFPHKSTWDLTIHPSGPSVLARTHSFLQSMWDPTKSTLLQGPHHLVSTHLQILSSLTFSFGITLKVFKTRMLGRGFHTFTKGYFVLLSNRGRISTCSML